MLYEIRWNLCKIYIQITTIETEISTIACRVLHTLVRVQAYGCARKIVRRGGKIRGVVGVVAKKKLKRAIFAVRTYPIRQG